ncbi:MAG: hypothetical protein QOJ50_2548, partial [Cryptosporangiaceae bacterium]|nr:hypothetical protein [Cryptosporangiaceae bacterium]
MTAVPQGMTGFDPDGLNALATSLASAQYDIDDAAARLRRALESLGLPVAPTVALREVSKWISEAKPAIERRRDLAFAATPLIRDPHNRTVNIKNDTIDLFPTQHDADTTARRIAAELRGYLQSHPGDEPDCRLIPDLQAYAGDPSFASALVGLLKPDELRRIPLLLDQRLHDAGQSSIREQDKFASLIKENGVIVSALGTALAAATRSGGGLPCGYEDALLEGVDDPLKAYGLSNLLRSGTYDTKFLAHAATVVSAADKRHKDDSHWTGFEAGFTGANEYQMSAGLPNASYGDPMTGLMDALSHNPVAAQQFITTDNLKYLLTERPWLDSGTAMGKALVAATTTFRDHAPDVNGKHSRGYVSAELASQALTLLAEKGDYTSGFRTAVATMLGAYHLDTSRAIRAGKVGIPGVNKDALSDANEPIPYGIILNKYSLTKILKESFKEPDSFKLLVSSISSYDLTALGNDAKVLATQVRDSALPPNGALKSAMTSDSGERFIADAAYLAADVGFLTELLCQCKNDDGVQKYEAQQQQLNYRAR